MLDSDIEFLIVGSGLTGATIARVLRDAGRRVAIVERRSHSGGNVHDQRHESGITYHTYGPHYFRTNSPKVWKFVQHFSSFTTYHPTIKTLVDGNIEDWPLRRGQIGELAGTGWSPAFQGTPSNFEEACLAKLPRIVYDKFVKGYTEKQWGIPATKLSTHLAKRIVVIEDDQTFGSLFRHSALPSDGYSAFVGKLLADIPLYLNFDFLKNKPQISKTTKIIFTGPIDEYFGFDLGRLQYRGQRREHRLENTEEFNQPAIQLNNPSPTEGDHVRTIEWKHLANQPMKNSTQTLLTKEIPYFPTDPEVYEYPMPDEQNAKLYDEYGKRAQNVENLIICGRLGEYRYLDMDQAIARALILAERLL